MASWRRCAAGSTRTAAPSWPSTTSSTTWPPFSNRALRLATSYAIDRDAINKDVLHGAHSTIYRVVPQGLPGYDARGKGAVPGYDLARARRYLALARRQMGKSFPSSLSITYASDVPGAEQEYVALQDQWRRIGLNVHIRRVPLNVWLGSLVKPTSSQAFRGGEPWVQGVWGADYPDPEDFTTALLSPSSTHNVGNYANPRFAALLDAARGATGNARARLYVEARRMALNDAAWAMIGQVTVTYCWSARITGLAVWSSNITASPQPRDNDWTNVDVQ